LYQLPKLLTFVMERRNGEPVENNGNYEYSDESKSEKQ
jgi:hypothetical protein